MQQRDIIKDEIEQLGRVLGKIFANFVGLKTQANINEVIQETNKKLETELDLDVKKILSLEIHELEKYIDLLKLTSRHLDQLSNYFFELGVLKKKDESNEEAGNYFKTAMRLLELAGEKSSTITFDRMSLKGKIENELDQDSFFDV